MSPAHPRRVDASARSSGGSVSFDHDRVTPEAGVTGALLRSSVSSIWRPCIEAAAAEPPTREYTGGLRSAGPRPGRCLTPRRAAGHSRFSMQPRLASGRERRVLAGAPVSAFRPDFTVYFFFYCGPASGGVAD